MHVLPDRGSDQLRANAQRVGTDINAALDLAVRVGATLAPPGTGHTLDRWAVLAATAWGGLTAARVLEAHSDALAILAEAGEPLDKARERSWGVFAAEARDARLDAVRDGRGVRLTGTKAWCSLAGVLDSALVTASVGERRQLFAVDLQDPGVTADPPQRWIARGLSTVVSAPVHFAAVPARPVGEPGWYLERPGFAWGGIGVAACWYGGALGLYDAVRRQAKTRDGELAALHVGVIDEALFAAASALQAAARDIDEGRAAGSSGDLLALRVRGVVAAAVETILRAATHALGPAPLAFDDDYARRVADLELYVRQHHGERDQAALGRAVLKNEA